MKKFWKILGLGALAAGLTPYKVEKNEETGENSYQALLWRITVGPGENETKKAIDINLGEGTLTSMLAGAAGKREEPHLFSDELSVEYTGPAAAAEEDVAAVTEQAAEETEPSEAPETQETPENPEPTEAEEPKAE